MKDNDDFNIFDFLVDDFLDFLSELAKKTLQKLMDKDLIYDLYDVVCSPGLLNVYMADLRRIIKGKELIGYIKGKYSIKQQPKINWLSTNKKATFALLQFDSKMMNFMEEYMQSLQRIFPGIEIIYATNLPSNLDEDETKVFALFTQG